MLNGIEQADLLLAKGFKRVALVTEQTEYTTDIAKHFKSRFVSQGGVIALEEEFLPDTTDFRSLIMRIKSATPQALFMSTQTGLAFGLFVKQLSQLNVDQGVEIHTNFLSADNPEARTAAGASMNGVRYMAPFYDKSNERFLQFFKEFEADHGSPPVIAFHSAGTVDALDLLQLYLDDAKVFDRDGFRDFLLRQVRNYPGLMGTYSFDEEGNANIGFEARVIAPAS